MLTGHSVLRDAHSFTCHHRWYSSV